MGVKDDFGAKHTPDDNPSDPLHRIIIQMIVNGVQLTKNERVRHKRALADRNPKSKQKISVRKASLLVPGVSAPFVNGNGEQAASDEVVVVSSEGEAEEERKP